MVLVNCPGDAYPKYRTLTHAPWHGWTFTDLIAPAFLWVVGVSMVLAVRRRLEVSAGRGKVLVHILRRSAIIYLVGSALLVVEVWGMPAPWQEFKVLGVLQRIAVSYLIAATLFVMGGGRGQAIWVVAGSLLYTYLSLYAPIPGMGSAPFDFATNAASHIDYLVLGNHGGNPHTLLSVLTSSTTISLGVLAGSLLVRPGLSDRRKALWILFFGVALILTGEVAGAWIPVNRRLWTPSFAFLTAGISAVTFALFFWLIEVVDYRRWTKSLVVFGLNPILIFSLSELGRIFANKKGITLADGHWLSYWDYAYQALYLEVGDPVNTSLVFSMIYVLLFWALTYCMSRRGWVVKI